MTKGGIISDEDGSVLVETLATLGIFMLVLAIIAELSIAFFQWNQANTALRQGARLAATLAPVSDDLGHAAEVGQNGIQAITDRICDGLSGSCIGGPSDGFDTGALSDIVYGPGSTSCFDATIFDEMGMCDVFPAIEPQNVAVTYTSSGLDFIGRPGGAVPVVSVSLKGLTFDFLALDAILGHSTSFAIPVAPVSHVAEDLSSTGPVVIYR